MLQLLLPGQGAPGILIAGFAGFLIFTQTK